jgi:pyruvate/2-oxoglutarate/acetoin dehydrogenase E1 component/TPP-dependent pyruvate/acetoin dehydrogenase alpha subunit
MQTAEKKTFTSLQLSADTILNDYRTAYMSRQASLMGRKEVLTGKAKFGIFGDGKEVAQVALAHSYHAGDIRSGYYRDQTMMFATGMSDIKKFFAQLYADTNPEREPATMGRQMCSHFSTRWLDENGHWQDLTAQPQSSADSSPTASQMSRMIGLAHASKLYRLLPDLQTAAFEKFSKNGNEIIFGTIGDASIAEGIFWEAMNAAGVLQVPLLMSVWDDGYGISVPKQYQTVKDSISVMLKGFHPEEGAESDPERGLRLYEVKGWDYEALVDTYARATQHMRQTHEPALIHVQEMTQQQGHSTSGSHERYKSEERLTWEREHDDLANFRQWIIDQGIATDEELSEQEKKDRKQVSRLKNDAFKAFVAPIKTEVQTLSSHFDALINALQDEPQTVETLQAAQQALTKLEEPIYRDVCHYARKALIATAHRPDLPARDALRQYNTQVRAAGYERFDRYLYSTNESAAVHIATTPPTYAAEPEQIPGFQILQQSFASFFEQYPNAVAFGEDLGYLGDVNQGMAGMQEKFGELRVSDTGIREATIIGQGIGLAMRGFRPIAEIQYLDYLLYGLQTLSDDLATLRWRSAGGQKAPLIVRTRGHRLEGIWHSGSPMGTIINALRGIYVLVPRDMTRAAGFYNTLLQSDDPAVLIEVLNGYRFREPKPENIGQYSIPLGVPETIRQGEHITLVTYGANCRIALEAADALAQLGVELEVIDAQTLVPFDRHHHILESLKKTSRLVVLDEDVPGGASSYILRNVLEEQDGYRWLDAKPETITAREHRAAYATDGDYFSKPNAEEVITRCYALMHEFDPRQYPDVL